MLTCTNLEKSFGGVKALQGIDLEIAPGEIVGLIGPNGSGKSTLVNVMTGFIRPDAGSVVLNGRELVKSGPARIRHRGLARTFQNLRLYERMTVLDNVLIGLHLDFAKDRPVFFGWVGGMVAWPSARRIERDARTTAMVALDSVGLSHKANQIVGNLSYGEQKRLELARATVVPPAALLLDEPTAGLSPDEAEELMRLFTSSVARTSDRCLMLIEHRLELVLGICDRVAVLDSGVKIADGTPDEIANDAEVMRVYVGDEAE